MPKTKPKQFTQAEAKTIGDKLGINWQEFDLQQFRMGLNIELEYGVYNPLTNFASEDPILAGKIARAHLNEDPDYYTQLVQMEKEAKLEYDRRQTVPEKKETTKKETKPKPSRKRTTVKTAKPAKAAKPKSAATAKNNSKEG